MKKLFVLLALLPFALAADEGNGQFLKLTIDTALQISHGASIQMLRVSSGTVNQMQWCLAGGTCDPTVVGGWTLGTDGSNNIAINAGQGGGVLTNVFLLGTNGNLAISGRLGAAGGNVTGTLTSGTLFVANGVVQLTALTAGSSGDAIVCVDSSGILYKSGCAPGAYPDITDSGGVVTITGSGLTVNGNIGTGGYISAVSGYQVNGTTIIDSSQDMTLTGSLSAHGISSLGGLSAAGNITSTTGYVRGNSIYINSTPVIDSSENLLNIGSITMSGNISAAGDVTAATSHFTSGASATLYQIGVTTVIDSGLNIVNAVNGTFSGSLSANGFSDTGGFTASGNITTTGGYLKASGLGTGPVCASSGVLVVGACTGVANGTVISALAQVYLDMHDTITGLTPSPGAWWRIFVDNQGCGGYCGNLTWGLFNVDANTIAIGVNNSNQVGIGTFTPSHTLDVAGTGNFTGAVTLSTSLSAGTTITANGLIGTAAGYQVGGVTIINSSQSETLTGPLSAAGISSTGGMSAAGNITASAGYVKSFGGFYEGSTQIIDTSLNIVNAVNGTFSGSLSANGFTDTGGFTANGNITSTGGYAKAFAGFYVGSTQIIDASRNIVNAGSGSFASSISVAGISSSNNISATGTAVFVQNGNRGISGSITTGTCTMFLAGGIIYGTSGC